MKKKSHQSGHAMAEWLIATMAMMLALFVPFDGDHSAVALFVQAVKDLHANTMYSLSLP